MRTKVPYCKKMENHEKNVKNKSMKTLRILFFFLGQNAT
jgi:hypothetical protein